MPTPPEAGDFCLIVEEVESGSADAAAREFARVFHLDETVATQVLRSAPILFARGLTKAEVKAVTPKLCELSERGIAFRLTAQPPAKMPKLNWPMRPQFTAAGSGSVTPAFEWDDSAFVCPSCGETFLFRRVGKPLPAPAPSPSAEAPAEEAVEKLDAAADVKDLAPLEPVFEDESAELTSLADEPPTRVRGVVRPAKMEDVLKSEPATEEPAEPPGDEESATEEAETSEESGEAGEQYNVFLSKIADRGRQEKAAELLSKIRGLDMREARQLASRLVIPVARNVSWDEAKGLLDEFKKHRIFGRITKLQ